MHIKIAILGVGGMLGSTVLDFFAKEKNFSIIATVRDQKEAEKFPKYQNVEFCELDVQYADSETFRKALKGAKWIINCIGIIKPYIHDDNAAEVERAVRINALFPHALAQSLPSAKIIQIATDCVYSGTKGKYKESDPHDALDVYGKTKSIGETYFKNMLNIRCSIVGREKSAHLSLMDWFLTQKHGASVDGYKNHLWNGVTTLHFAKICKGIIEKNINVSHLQHLLPKDKISKGEMLKIFAKHFRREDIKITVVNHSQPLDRTLATEKPDVNKKLWKAAGYSMVPTIEQMIRELQIYLEGEK